MHPRFGIFLVVFAFTMAMAGIFSILALSAYALHQDAGVLADTLVEGMPWVPLFAIVPLAILIKGCQIKKMGDEVSRINKQIALLDRMDALQNDLNFYGQKGMFQETMECWSEIQRLRGIYDAMETK